jgi:predicted O-methyltransferase YrrM
MDSRYWLRAVKANIAHLRRTPGFGRELINAGLRADSAPKAPVRDLLTAYPQIEDLAIDLGIVTYRRSNLDPLERFVIAALATLGRARRIFEIGTYDGATTLLLARAAPDAEILTLDLPRQAAELASVALETANVSAGVGSRFHGRPEEERIMQLFGDSREFDFTPWHGTVDLVIIDGGHEYSPAKADTATAVALLAPGGTAIWDDYTVGWPGVVQAIDETGLSVFRVAGTDLAVYSPSSA